MAGTGGADPPFSATRSMLVLIFCQCSACGKVQVVIRHDGGRN